MIRYLTVDEVIELHHRVIEQTGGLPGIRDHGALDSALAQPQMTFDGQELYPSLAEKATALCYSLVCNHPFFDGNKRIGHAATEAFLILNGWEITASVDEQERIITELTSGTLTRSALTSWLQSHTTKWPK